MSEAAFEAGASALRHADRSRAELDERLARAGHDAAAREAALNRLEELGWLDDRRTAAARAASLAGRGYGNAYIRADLGRRGLPADEALAELEPERERVRRYAGRGRAWLARRGFELEDVVDFAAQEPAG